MKSYGTMEGVYINGAPQGITFHETDNFTLYPASILSVNKNRFTKHYFIGDKRIASRIGTGLFNNVYGRNGSYVTAGQQDYAERMDQIQTQKEAYYKKVGVAPGVPTEKGAYGDPENTGVGIWCGVRAWSLNPTLWHIMVAEFCEDGIITNARVLWITIRTLLCRYARSYTHLLIIRLLLCLYLIHTLCIVLLTSRYV